MTSGDFVSGTSLVLFCGGCINLVLRGKCRERLFSLDQGRSWVPLSVLVTDGGARWQKGEAPR